MRIIVAMLVGVVSIVAAMPTRPLAAPPLVDLATLDGDSFSARVP
jgi:hypothetical protein